MAGPYNWAGVGMSVTKKLAGMKWKIFLKTSSKMSCIVWVITVYRASVSMRQLSLKNLLVLSSETFYLFTLLLVLFSFVIQPKVTHPIAFAHWKDLKSKTLNPPAWSPHECWWRCRKWNHLFRINGSWCASQLSCFLKESRRFFSNFHVNFYNELITNLHPETLRLCHLKVSRVSCQRDCNRLEVSWPAK